MDLSYQLGVDIELLKSLASATPTKIRNELRKENSKECPITVSICNIVHNLLRNAILPPAKLRAELVRFIAEIKILGKPSVSLRRKHDTLEENPKLVRYLSKCFLANEGN